MFTIFVNVAALIVTFVKLSAFLINFYVNMINNIQVTCLYHIRLKISFLSYMEPVILFCLLFNVPVNNCGHVETVS